MESTNKKDIQMEGDEKKAEQSITIEGKNFIGEDVISKDFMSRIRKIQTYYEGNGR